MSIQLTHSEGQVPDHYLMSQHVR